jgi:hypothetical protein
MLEYDEVIEGLIDAHVFSKIMCHRRGEAPIHLQGRQEGSRRRCGMRKERGEETRLQSCRVRKE